VLISIFASKENSIPENVPNIVFLESGHFLYPKCIPHIALIASPIPKNMIGA
jgi:hypothetical protein